MKWIRVRDDRVCRDFEKLYLSAFPLDERREMIQLRDLIDKRENLFCEAAYDGERFAGFICWWRFADFVFVEHMAVGPEFRNCGYGTAMLTELLNRSKMPVVLEVAADGASVDVLRRIEFYKKLGFVLNEHDYLQPPYSDDKKYVRMHLMSYPDALTAEEFEKAKAEIYKVVYGAARSVTVCDPCNHMSQKNDPFHPLKIRGLCLKNNLIAAPMAGLSTLPYRLLALEQGAALAFSEMISATGIVLGRNKKTSRYFYNDPSVRPFAAQLFGSEPEHISKAVEMLADDPIDLIDINMGCPVRKVCSKGAGSALMKTPKLAGCLIAAARKVTDKPLTVKIRAGWDAESINCVELARIAEASGADALIIHPRTRQQMFGGHSDWSLITEVKRSISIPVIGNGDVKCRDDAIKMLSETGCDGVMVGRAAVGNPWIFRQILDSDATAPTIAERGVAAMCHLEHLCSLLGEQQAVLQMRTMFSWYGKGLRGVKSWRGKVCSATTKTEIQTAIRAFFS